MRQYEPVWPIALVAVITAAMLLAGCSPAPGAVSPSSGAASQVPSATAGASATSPTAPSASPSQPAGSPSGLEGIPLAQGTLNAVWIGDGQIVAVGGSSGAAFKPAILVYEAGAWSEATIPDAGGQVMGVARLGGRFIAVGNELPDARNGFIWTSQDGRTWTSARSIAGAALYDVVATHDVAVAVGAHLNAEMTSTAAAWTSSDATRWSEARVGGAARASMRAVAVWPNGFAAAGDAPHDRTRPIWTATDPGTWTSLRTDLALPLLVIDVAGWSGGLVSGGATDKAGNQHPFVALSGDGRQWKRTNLSAEEGYVSAVGLAGERVVVAGVDADRLTLWTLEGAAWQAETIEPIGAAIGGLGWSPEFGLVGVGARDGNQAVWMVREP
jgi:hypothetical protein